jgi:carbonic anhydrase
MSGIAFTRRHLCGCAAGMAATLAASRRLLAAGGDRTTLTPDEALARLKEGNERFMAGKLPQEAQDTERRLAIARGQTPFAVLVGCSDSRVPPELLFGRGLGELFIVRNAGNTVDTAALGSIEYGVAELGVPLVVVLGHERCGAVAAAVEVVERNAHFPGSIGAMVEPIVPAVLEARSKVGAADHDRLLDESVRANVARVVGRLRGSEPILLEPLRAGKLKIVGARYDLEDGRVEFFEVA